MFKLLRNKKGQGIAVQYVVTFFLVLGFVTLMAAFVRRAIQARIRDTRMWMASTVADVTRENVLISYEPYYLNTEVARLIDAEQERLYGESSAPVGIFELNLDETTQVISNARQAPPRDAD